MQTRTIKLLDTARDDLSLIDDWLTANASATVASRFVNRILHRLESLAYAPERGTLRPEMIGLRVIGLTRNVSVAFVVSEHTVIVYRIIYGGQNCSAVLATDEMP